MKSLILREFMRAPWAILPEKLAQIQEVLIRYEAGASYRTEDLPEAPKTIIQEAARPVAVESPDAQPGQPARRVAVMPLFGTIFPRANLMTTLSGATSAEMFGAEFAALVADPEIDAIVLDVDSPGGYAPGISELSEQIYRARGIKPVAAVANHMMASAAYWIASAADEVVMTPSGSVGSVGVFAIHQDISAALMQAGHKISLIHAGQYKVEGNPYQPLDSEARAAIQADVDETYLQFIADLARNRDQSTETVQADFGRGRMLNARQAEAVGMVDRIARLGQVVAELLDPGVQAKAPTPPIIDTLESGPVPGQTDPAPVEPSERGGETARAADILRDEIQAYLQKESKNGA